MTREGGWHGPEQKKKGESENGRRSRFGAATGCSLILLCYLLLVMHLYWPNSGGMGLSLPFNILAWISMALAGLMILLLRREKRVIRVAALPWLLAGAILLTLPLLWSPLPAQQNAWLRIAGLWGGIAFYWLLQQAEIRVRQRHWLFFALVSSALIEALIALWQLFFANKNNWMDFVPHTRAYGIFQQPNVLASFLAIGLAVALHLALYRRQRLAQWGLGVALLIFPAVLVLLGSRIGWLAGGMVALWGGVMYRRRPHLGFYLGIMLLGSLVGGILLLAIARGWLPYTQVVIDKASSTQARWLLLRTSVAMLLHHPWQGWGYGNFAYSLVTQRDLPSPQHLIWRIDHPHNEALFWWVEGGICAIVGTLLLLGGIVRAAWENPRAAWPCLWMALPIALHLMTEYPLYLSVPHYLVLLVLLALIPPRRRHELTTRIPWRASFALGCVATIVFMLGAFQAQRCLTRFEHGGLREPALLQQIVMPEAQWQNYQYDRHTALLLQFNYSRDRRLLEQYERWAAEYCLVANDKNVYRTRIAIADALGETALSTALRQTYRQIFPPPQP
ncbi:PglL family O-oligosaccharyltransferase [Edwardsiella anguillarum]|uniref:PglL family O-oligosaccharyltransferase n=1 Tax=Edwardsiella anguillarum TaxID=1821960 RepID=UPI0024B75E08|nr:PglL family O-oligosaccharyltransferase [Edwardsiella anguillarum]WHP79140.1 PglL family O-oligosaccharyltransferase [Edwardsiella anguillarum]WHQ15241.1 PglL family O-oligosaccharyltransferase [Edwardsiella anguillarum]WHQ16598.1 PglL family O-oligosaccharyltransferase [Edwardsiella anguillarum]WHQ20134.1 PglL family O-oligosaccharyltransferase [Edwardsiella anguillarum]WHQ23655.1 PglL family O-oligosaccharyltransferase [Edwardsiella anguillarum]